MPNFSIIKPSVERIDEEDNLKRIELAGRVCYKSEKKITDDSALAFCKRIIDSGHTSVLEHSNVIVKVPVDIGIKILDAMGQYKRYFDRKSMLYADTCGSHSKHWIISGNVRAWYETLNFGSNILTFADDPILNVNYIGDDLTDLTPYVITADELTPAERLRHDRISLRIICDRGVSHEIVRHRVMSFSQESTRYAKYGKRGYTFIEPWWWNDQNGTIKHYMLSEMQHSINVYQAMINDGATPQLARAVLPNQIKTELVVTATPLQWAEFLRLRMAKDAHPDMQRIAHLVRNALGDDVSFSRGGDNDG